MATFSLNGQVTSTQTLTTGISGTDFNIASLLGIHTFNIPDASALARGLLTTGDWSIFNSKQDALGYTSVPNTTTINGLALTGNISFATADILDSLNKRYVTDAQLIVLGNSSGTNTGDQTTISGNAGTASALEIARIINGVSFDGTENITVTASAGTLTGTSLASGVVDSSLTSVGTLGSLALGGGITGTGNIGLQIAGTGITGNVQIGAGGGGSATPDLLVMDIKSSSGDPTGTNGAIYYNSNTSKFRCFENGAWSNCITPPGGDIQHAASYDTTEALTNIGTSKVTVTSVSVTPSMATGDVYVRGKAEILSSNNTDQSFVFSIEDDATCTGSTLATNIITITSSSGTVIGDFEIAAIEVDAGASSQSYSLCASTATGDTDIRFYEMFATVIDTGADLAEIYTTNDESVEAGDVVSLDQSLKTGIRKSINTYDQHVLGIVATRPGMLIGGVEKEGVKALPVALSGRVPVKVVTENGAIVPGDYLSPSSIPGVAMKAMDGGLVVGQAMSTYDGEDIGTVLVFVKNFVFNENITSLEDITAIQTEVTRNPILVIADKIFTGIKFLTDLVVARITAIRGYFEEIFTKKLHTEEFCIKKSDGDEVCVNGDQVEILLQKNVVAPTINTPSQASFESEQLPTPTTPNETSTTTSEIITSPTNEPTLAETPTDIPPILPEAISPIVDEPTPASTEAVNTTESQPEDVLPLVETP